MRQWEINKQRSDLYINSVRQIIKDNIKYLVEVVVASNEKDTKEATDFVIVLKGGDVAVRLRFWSCYTVKQEWTIRSRLDSGMETELSKLKKGFARWYLYGWVKDNILFSWMLIDLNMVREKKLLDLPWYEKSNHDGTHFIIVPNIDLYKHQCIVAFENIDALKFHN